MFSLNQLQKQQEMQQLRRNNLLKMMLMTFGPLPNTQYQSSMEPRIDNHVEADNGLHYKIVHLKFNIEPQQSKRIVTEPNRKAKYLDFLPQFLKNILNPAQQPSEILSKESRPSLLFKRNYDEQMSESDAKVTHLKKRDLDETKNSEKLNDNQLQESFRSLQRRELNTQGGDEEEDSENKDKEMQDLPVSLSERSDGEDQLSIVDNSKY